MTPEVQYRYKSSFFYPAERRLRKGGFGTEFPLRAARKGIIMEQIPVTNVTAKGERQESTEVHLQDQLADLNLNKTLQAETTAQPAAVSTVTKIFVGGLLRTTTTRSLREYFEQFGQIDEAVVKE